MATDVKTDTIKDNAGNEFEMKRTLTPEGNVQEQWARKGEEDPKKRAAAEAEAAAERAQAAADAGAELAAAEAEQTRANAVVDAARIAARNTGGTTAVKTPHEYAVEAAAAEKAEEAKKAEGKNKPKGETAWTGKGEEPKAKKSKTDSKKK